jgi:hypothetical protein
MVVAGCLNVCDGLIWLRHLVIKQIVIHILAEGGHVEYSVSFDLYSVGTCSVFFFFKFLMAGTLIVYH